MPMVFGGLCGFSFFLAGDLSHKPEQLDATLKTLADYVVSGRIKVHMDGAFPLSKAIETHRQQEGRRIQGKLVIRI